jgi:hypothetical protein
VADRLRDAGYDIYLNPRGAAAREFAIRERTVVIRPRPTTQPRDGHLVTIEGLLVDLFIERRTLHLMDEGEYFRMFANLAGRGTGLRAGTPSGQAAPHTTYQSGVFAKLRFGQFIPGTGSAGARQRLPTIGLFTIQ